MQKEQAQESPITFLMHNDSTLEAVLAHSPSKQERGNIYFGSVEALTLPIITTYKIGAVLTVMTEKEKRKSKLDQRIEDLDDISKHMSLTIHEEDQTIAPYFYSTLEFIREATAFGLNALVQCKNGNDRSPALMAAYLIAKFQITAEKALGIVKEKKATIKISQYLEMQVKEEEQKLQEQSFKLDK